MPSREWVTTCSIAPRGMEETIPSTSPRRPSTTELAFPGRSHVLPSCGKLYIRLDTHLKNSATCKTSTLSQPNHPQPQNSSQGSQAPETDPSQEVHTSAHMAANRLAHFQPLSYSLPSRPPRLLKSGEKMTLNWLKPLFQQLLIEAQSVEDKNRILCEGIYNHALCLQIWCEGQG